MEDFESHAELILTKEYDDLLNGRETYSLVSENNQQILIYPHAETLIELFSTIQTKSTLKDKFIQILSERISTEYEKYYQISGSADRYASSIGLCFFTLLKLGFTEKAIVYFKKYTLF